MPSMNDIGDSVMGGGDFGGVGSNLNGGSKGGLAKPGGGKGAGSGYATGNGVPVTPKGAPRLTPLPGIPDVDPGASIPDPVDLSALVLDQELPERRPLKSQFPPVSVPSSQITGASGVFIP